VLVPNLMVRDIATSVAYYSEVFDLKLIMSTDDSQNYVEGMIDGAVFAMLDGEAGRIMLQKQESLTEEWAGFANVELPAQGASFYFRDVDPDQVASRVPAESILRGPEQTWYGMRELWLLDPDGHVLTVGKPNNP